MGPRLRGDDGIIFARIASCFARLPQHVAGIAIMRLAQSALGEVGYGDEDGCLFLTDRKALHPDLLAPLHEDKLICVRARAVVFLEAAGRRVSARRLRLGELRETT